MKNLFSKAMALTLAVLMVVSQMMFVSVAEDTEIPDCLCENPSYEMIGHVDPTCGEYGYDVYICADCGGKHTVNTDRPTGQHNYNIPEATCTEDSYCVECGFVNEEATGHSLDTVPAQDPTCDAIGWGEYKACNNCDYTEGYEEIPATGHTYELVGTVEPTCKYDDATGEYVFVAGANNYKCACGAELSEEIAAPTEHLHYETQRVEKTCDKNAFILHTCDVCGYRLEEILFGEGNEAGHELVQVEAQAPTCDVIGWDAYEYCTECNYSTYVELPATGHDFGTEVFTKVATCLEGGYDYTVCSVCGAEDIVDGSETDIDDLNGHANKLVGRVEPTCTSTGWTGDLTCELCDKLLNSGKEIPMVAHEIVSHPAQAPACGEVGWEAYETCANCDYTTYVEIDALEHVKKGISLGVVKPTCTDGGYSIWECELCFATFRADFVDALGHTIVSVDAKAATCTEAGYNAHEYCTVCDYTTYEAIDALGHTEVIDEAVEPTCTETGLTEGKHCSVCEEVLVAQDVVDALGHTNDEGTVVIVDPTCTENGKKYIEYACTVCGETYVNDLETKEMPPLGHDLVENEVPATAESIGYIETSCNRCDYYVNTPIDEEITFTYKLTGINGADVAVNSGFVTVEVYANVITDYARIHGVDFAFNYDAALTYEGAESAFLDDFLVKNYADSYAVKFTANLNSDVDVVLEKGEYLVATLKFAVDADCYNADVTLTTNVAECFISRADYAIEDVVATNSVVATYSDDDATIFVALLGDSDGDLKITTNDDYAFYAWYFNNDGYNAILDMNKDGVISEADNWLLRAEILNIA